MDNSLSMAYSSSASSAAAATSGSDSSSATISTPSSDRRGVSRFTTSVSPSLRTRNGDRVVGGRYLLGKTLGGGVEGKVKLCIDTHTGEEVAVKIVPRENYARSKNSMRRILDEVKIMRWVARFAWFGRLSALKPSRGAAVRCGATKRLQNSRKLTKRNISATPFA